MAMDTLFLSNESEEMNTFEKIMTVFLGTLDQGRTFLPEFNPKVERKIDVKEFKEDRRVYSDGNRFGKGGVRRAAQ